MKAKCGKCGYCWKTKSKLFKVTCPSCNSMVRIKPLKDQATKQNPKGENVKTDETK